MERKKKADGSVDLEERLNQYIRQEKGKAIDRLAEDEQLPTELLNRFLSEYDFSQKVQPEIIQAAVKEKHLGLLKTAQNRETVFSTVCAILSEHFLGTKRNAYENK